jgi:hypothetical protein
MGGSMNLVYARETMAMVRPEIAGLLAAHWDEVAHDKDSRELDVHWEAFEALEAAGQLFLMTVRDGGALVGYVAAFLRPHLHSRRTISAYVDALFLSPVARAGMAGARFLKYVDAALAALADFIYWHIKPEKDFAPILQRSLGYHYVEAIWGRATNRMGR